MSTAATLPRWDMTVVFAGLDSAEFHQAFADLEREIAELTALCDAERVERQPRHPLDDDAVRAFETVLPRFNAVLERARTIGAYISAFVSTDSRDTTAQARLSELQRLDVRLTLLGQRFTAWIGSLDLAELERRSTLAREHAYALHLERIEAEHQLPPGEEALAAELEPSSGTAWSKLHGTMTSQVSVPVAFDGRVEELPMSAVRNLAYDADRAVRRAAYDAELAAWPRVAVPLAAALNSVKGEVDVLTRKRGWQTPLDQALFGAHIDRETLDAMLGAARESFPIFRRYLHAKARALGLPVLAWYDLFAPVGTSQRTWSFAEASEFVVRNFGAYSPRMADFAARAFRERWVDAEPRPGKRDGAFCMWLRGDESRIMANFKPSYGGMSTLAHELGHGYHNLNLAGRTPFQRATPMTLAETASIFAETVVKQAALQDASAEQQLLILEASLQGDCQVVVDITSRFRFEGAVFERRRRRELAIEELNELMLDAQRQTYGDGLDPQALHPYMWAVKQHYYSAGRSYYNFPYMFGLLFGLGLYARFQADPEAFRGRYDELLASTGLADAAALASRFGIELRAPDFWRGSLDLIRRDVERFEALVG